MPEFNMELDTRGLNCPLPILKMRKAMNAAEPGHVVRMISSDPGSLKDMESFCRQTGFDLLSSEQSGGEFIYMVRKV